MDRLPRVVTGLPHFQRNMLYRGVVVSFLHSQSACNGFPKISTCLQLRNVQKRNSASIMTSAAALTFDTHRVVKRLQEEGSHHAL